MTSSDIKLWMYVPAGIKFVGEGWEQVQKPSLDSRLSSYAIFAGNDPWSCYERKQPVRYSRLESSKVIASIPVSFQVLKYKGTLPIGMEPVLLRGLKVLWRDKDPSVVFRVRTPYSNTQEPRPLPIKIELRNRQLDKKQGEDLLDTVLFLRSQGKWPYYEMQEFILTVQLEGAEMEPLRMEDGRYQWHRFSETSPLWISVVLHIRPMTEGAVIAQIPILARVLKGKENLKVTATLDKSGFIVWKEVVRPFEDAKTN